VGGSSRIGSFKRQSVKIINEAKYVAFRAKYAARALHNPSNERRVVLIGKH
jgi:hypothetical protein